MDGRNALGWQRLHRVIIVDGQCPWQLVDYGTVAAGVASVASTASSALSSLFWPVFAAGSHQATFSKRNGQTVQGQAGLQ